MELLTAKLIRCHYPKFLISSYKTLSPFLQLGTVYVV